MESACQVCQKKNETNLCNGCKKSESDSFKKRNTYYHEEKHSNSQSHQHSLDQQEDKVGCCSTFHSKIYIPLNQRNSMERVCGEIFDKHKLKNLLVELLDFLQTRFFKIKEGGIKDKLKWDKGTEQYLLNQVAKEGCQMFFNQRIKEQLQKEQKIDCKQPMLLATPSGWEKQHPKQKLDFLCKEALQSLNEKNYAVIPNFTNNPDYCRSLFKELQFLERDGRFKEPIGEESIRNDLVLWVGLGDIDKSNFKSIHHIANILASMPFEMNKKDMKFFAQCSEMFQLSYFKETGTFHKPHVDSSFEKARDTGRTLTVLYLSNIDFDYKLGDSEKGFVQLYPDQKDTNNAVVIEQATDTLIVLKSRLVAYEITQNTQRRYILRYWVNGPQDSENRKF